MQSITSIQNTLVKQIVSLQNKSRERKKAGLFVVEGQREISLAIQANYAIKTLLFYDALFSEKQLEQFIQPQTEVIEISKKVYEKLAYRSSTEGILAIAKTKEHNLSNLILKSENPLLLIAEAPEKPGNIGALLRTADAANLDAVIIANPKTDLYNPNTIRSSVGCVFTNHIATGTTSEIITYLESKKIAIFCAALQASQAYNLIDFKQSSALVVGTEATGLSKEWLTHATQNIIIPMQGKIDSMNVSVAAGILVFEAIRQRSK